MTTLEKAKLWLSDTFDAEPEQQFRIGLIPILQN